MAVVGVFSGIVADASDLETIVFPVTDCESLFASDSDDACSVVGVFSDTGAGASDLETIVFPITDDCESLFASDSGDTCSVGTGFSEVVVVDAAGSTVWGVVDSSFALELTALEEPPTVLSKLFPAFATVGEVATSVVCSSTKAAVASSAFTS
ncbi:hypothetical protein SCODD09_00635 [Streptococcus constellatus]|nr:hypothetical protein SCODD09_00635 [Streptococcus constellatus]